MCGRFTHTKPELDRLLLMEEIELPPLFRGRYNIAPAQEVIAMRDESPGRITTLQWGLNSPRGSLVINARIETLPEKPMFRNLGRCLIFSDGFYEWKREQPYYFQLPDSSTFAFAGLWKENRCVIVTRAASRDIAAVHDRMPVILPDRAVCFDWIENQRIPETPARLTAHPVSTRVNRVKNDDPACIAPAPVQGDFFI